MKLQLACHFAFWKKLLSFQPKFALINTPSLFAVVSGVIWNMVKSRIYSVTFTAALLQRFVKMRCRAVPGLTHGNCRTAFRLHIPDFLWNPSAWNAQSSACCILRGRAENISFSIKFLLLIWFYAMTVNSVFYLLICFIKCLLMNNKKRVIKTVCGMVTTLLSQSQSLNYSPVCCCTQPCFVSNACYWNVHWVLAGSFGWICITFCYRRSSTGISFCFICSFFYTRLYMTDPHWSKYNRDITAWKYKTICVL